MPLVDILMNVFDGVHVEGEFSIDMALKLKEQEWRERDYISVVHHMTSDVMMLAIIWATIKWVAIIINGSLLLKGSREVL